MTYLTRQLAFIPLNKMVLQMKLTCPLVIRVILRLTEFSDSFWSLHLIVSAPTTLNLSPRIFGSVALCIFSSHYVISWNHESFNMSPLILSFMNMKCTIMFSSLHPGGETKWIVDSKSKSLFRLFRNKFWCWG
jgi:hypothetical protein